MWDDVIKVYEDGGTIPGTIVERVKEGFLLISDSPPFFQVPKSVYIRERISTGISGRLWISRF